jgi:putative ABC transport system permease protein
MWGDAKSALRNLRAAPAYTLAAILTLALAIAANTAIFGVVYAILLRPLPIHDPDRLVVVWETDPAGGQTVMELTYRQFEGWSSEARGVERLAVMSASAWDVVLEGRGDPTRLASIGVSSSFFETLGARAAIGRLFTPTDDSGAAGDVVVLSHGTWVERFGADPAIIGKALRLSGRPHTVVGVMPRDFDFPRGTDLWKPVMPVLLRSSAEWKSDVLANVGLLHVVARLRSNVSMAAARAEFRRLAGRFPYFAGQPKATVVTPLLDYTLGPLREGLWWLLGAVGILLLVACANVSGLTLTRAAVRRREHAIRLALGASRGRLARLWLAEAVVLGIGGGLAGVIGARWLLVAIVALAPADVPRVGDIGVNLPVAVFTLAITVLAAIFCAMAALLHTSAARVGDVLNEAARATAGPASNRIRATLVVAQIALAVMLLVSAGLVVRSFAALQRLDVGYDPANVLTLAVDPASAEMPAQAWFNEVIERIEALPGVASAGAVFLRPLAYGAIGTDQSMLYEGQGGTLAKAIEDGSRNPKLNFQMATPGYFRTMRIPLVRGRLFDDRDRAGSPRVVVIGERAAERLWPGQDPIGKRLNTPQHSKGVFGNAWHTVIGVVKDVHYRGINDVRNDLYEPAAQSLRGPEFLVVRTTGDPLAIAAAVQAQIRAHDRRAVVSGITTLEAILGRELAPWRLSSWMLAIFATIAFLLAVVGLVGLMGLEVAQRLREYAVRVALGAQPHQVRAHVYRTAAVRAAIGLTLGIASALAVTQWMRALLFGVSPVDPPTYAFVCTTVGLTVLAVSLVPAARAARVDPIEILKRE